MADVLNVNNVYQLLAFLIVAGLQIWTKWGVNKLASDQAQLKSEMEATRAEMFRRAKTNGNGASVIATIEAALKVAYLQGKADGTKPDVPYPQERIAAAARQLAEQAIHSQGPPPVPAPVQEQGPAVQP